MPDPLAGRPSRVTLHLGRRRRNKKDHEVKKNSRVKVPKATVKKNRDHIKEAPWKKDRDYLQRATWKKDRDDLKKHLAATMNKVMGRKAANQAEDEKNQTEPKTGRLSGNVWRIWRTSLTC